MTQPPVISGGEGVAALERAGFTVQRHVGSRIVMHRDDPFVQTVALDHGLLDRGVPWPNIRQARMRADDFVRRLGA